MKIEDDSLMKFGKHKGTKMCNVPDYYLRWLYENGKAHFELKAYIEDNAQSLKITIIKSVS